MLSPDNMTIEKILGTDEAYSLLSVLEELERGTDILLHRFGYDGEDWEALEGCLKRSKEYRQRINTYLSEKFAENQ